MSYKHLLIASLLLISFSLQAKDLVNALAVGNGQLISFSSTYGGNWSPAYLTDGSAEKGWASKKNEPTPHTFVYELKGNILISQIVVDNSGTEEKNYPGISAKQIQVLMADQNIEEAYRPVLTIEAPQGSNATFDFPQTEATRFIKFVVLSNHGDRKDYTEIMELEAFGVSEENRPDLLNLASGAVMLDYSSEYSSWYALNLLDGGLHHGWASTKNAAFPHRFVVELAGTYAIDTLVIDNTSAEEGTHPGISAQEIHLYASTEAADKGYGKPLKLTAARGRFSTIKFDVPVVARWLKLEIASNYGRTDYTEIMELEAYGKLIKAAPKGPPVAAVYKTNYDLMLVEQEGNLIRGCYDHDGGMLSGGVNERVLQFEWREQGPQIGTAIMVLTQDGSFLNGLWYEGGKLQGKWFGCRVTDGSRPRCTDTIKKQDALESRLSAVGRAILYGLHFDYNSDQLRPESEQTLQQILAYLKADTSRGIVIEGHTDSSGNDNYNQKLSERRAKSVAAWLKNNGIEANNLKTIGYGEAKPVSDNNTPQGQALNRRVEIATRAGLQKEEF